MSTIVRSNKIERKKVTLTKNCTTKANIRKKVKRRGPTGSSHLNKRKRERNCVRHREKEREGETEREREIE